MDMKYDENFYVMSVAEAIEDWMVREGYEARYGADGKPDWYDGETGEKADWDAIYDKVWALDDVTGNGPNGGFPYVTEGELWAAVKSQDFSTFCDILREWDVSWDEVGNFSSWREFAQYLDTLARLYVLGPALGAVRIGQFGS